MTTETITQKFERKLRNIEGMKRRIDNRQLTGRNGSASEATLNYNYRQLAAMISEDAQTEDAPLCSYLDSKPKTADRWNKIERWMVGLK